MSMTTMKSIQARAEYFGVETKPWFKGDMMRLYAQGIGRKDITVYLELEGASKDEITGGTFKVFCSTRQHPNWIRSQVKQYRELFLPMWHAYVVEHYADSDLSGYGDDIVEMVEASRAFLHEFEASEPIGDSDDDEQEDAA